MTFKTTRASRQDVKRILGYSRRHHGDEAAERYAALIVAAIRDVGALPERRGSVASEIVGVRSYAIHHSRLRVEGTGPVGRSAHKLVYRVLGDVVEILAVVGEGYPPELVVVPR